PHELSNGELFLQPAAATILAPVDRTVSFPTPFRQEVDIVVPGHMSCQPLCTLPVHLSGAVAIGERDAMLRGHANVQLRARPFKHFALVRLGDLERSTGILHCASVWITGRDHVYFASHVLEQLPSLLGKHLGVFAVTKTKIPLSLDRAAGDGIG